MKIIVLGAGQVARVLIAALHEEHDITVIDVDQSRLAALSDRYDLRTVEGDGTTRRVVRKAGVEDADLLIACSPREEANLVCAMLVKRLSNAQTVVRTGSMEYLDAWRAREIEVDFMVSSELETANAIAGIIGMPAARQTDVFADGAIQIVEFDVPENADDDTIIGRELRHAGIPGESKVAGIIRGAHMIMPRGDERILHGDRVVVIASPDSARSWSRIISRSEQPIEDIVIFGAGRMGTTIARIMMARDIRVRLVDPQRSRAEEVAELLPQARVYHASAFDPDFLEHERIGRSTAAVFCMNDDPKNLYAAVLAKAHGVRLTIALMHDPVSGQVYERGGVDIAIDPRQVTAEEMVRFAHDPRIRQIAMLEGDRFEILDITVRPESELADKAFKDLPMTGSVIGAMIRDGKAIFPHKTDVLRAGDRVIVFVESRRASIVEHAL